MFKKRVKRPVHINFKIPPVTQVVNTLFGMPNDSFDFSFTIYRSGSGSGD